MSDERRKRRDIRNRADKALKEDYRPSLLESPRRPNATWTGVTFSLSSPKGTHSGGMDAGCPWRSGDICRLTRGELAREFLKIHRAQRETFLNILAAERGETFAEAVRVQFTSCQIARAFVGGYMRRTIRVLAKSIQIKSDIHYRLNAVILLVKTSH